MPEVRDLPPTLHVPAGAGHATCAGCGLVKSKLALYRVDASSGRFCRSCLDSRKIAPVPRGRRK